MLLSGEVFIDKVLLLCNSLPKVLMDNYGIKSAQFPSTTDPSVILNALRASLDKKCCDKHFKVVIIDPSDKKSPLLERMLQE